MASEMEQILEDLAKKYQPRRWKAAVCELRESGLLRLLEALGEWEREEFAPLKDPLLVHQRRKELRAALAAMKEKAHA